jgi:hypothetical protein
MAKKKAASLSAAAHSFRNNYASARIQPKRRTCDAETLTVYSTTRLL